MKKPDQTRTLSSSSYRENIAPETLHSKSIGCLSGIVNLVSKYHNRRKFLTFGKRQEKINAVSSPAKPKPSSVSTTQAYQSVELQEQSAKEGEDAAVDHRKLSCDMQRSPTLPAEMRRSNSSNSPQKFRTPPALIAKLMGLEGMPESAAEKRRKLLGALEKCNEDLNALRKIIESVQFSEQLKSTDAGQHVDDGPETNRLKRWSSEFMNGEQQQPSPVSVLDEFTPSPSSTTGQYCHSRRHANGRVQQHQKQRRKKPGEEETTKIYFHDRINITETVDERKGDNVGSISSIWSSKAMIESVDEVCRDIDWGKRREIGRIGLALQDHICRDLIEEIVGEMGCCCMQYAPLPLEACKRRLCF